MLQPVLGCHWLNSLCLALQVRDVLDMFWDATVGTANEAADKYANDTEGIPEVRNPTSSRGHLSCLLMPACFAA